MRPSSSERGYDARWNKAVKEYKIVHPYCLGCRAVDKLVATQVVDHVEPHKGDQTKFWNMAMWQPACQWHHNSIKPQLERMYHAGKIKIGDLWLNSAKAVELTKRGTRRIGPDGWPTPT